MKKLSFILALMLTFSIQNLWSQDQETFYFSKTVKGSFDEIVDKTKSAFKQEGFGVITEIDMDVKLKEKLDDVEMRPYKILGVCNPAYAYKTLQIEENIGVFLPCKVIVKDIGGGEIEIVAMDPSAVMGILNEPELLSISKEVSIKFQSALKLL